RRRGGGGRAPSSRPTTPRTSPRARAPPWASRSRAQAREPRLATPGASGTMVSCPARAPPVPPMHHGCTLFALVLLGASATVRAEDKPAPPAKPTAEGIEFFEKKVRPVLVKHCYQCHGEDAKKRKGELRLDSRDAVLRGGATG